MKILGFEITRQKNQFPKPRVEKKPPISSSTWGQTFSVLYNGEKNVDEIGPVSTYVVDFQGLSNRSWKAYLDSDISKTILDRFGLWVIDKGLKIQCSPNRRILESEGINIDTEEFNEIVESRFNTWAGSKRASFNGMVSLNETAKEGFKNAKVGGDVLVILRLENGNVKVELKDGRHVQSPFIVDQTNANRIVHGVEMDPRGRHLRYHIKKRNLEFETIEAFDETTGLRTAFLVFGSKYRLDDFRGLPKIAVSLETIAKTDRYKEATVGSAEERSKIAYTIEHNQHSDGENPLGPFADMVSNQLDETGIPVDEVGNQLAKTVTSTTNKQTFNMPIGSQLKSLVSDNELQFKEFYSTNADIISSACGIPPNVAFSMYNDSFSASRAATKDWDHTIEFERDDFKNQFYSHIYAFWFHFEVLMGKIQAPGYLQAFASQNWIVVETYLNCRFTGPLFPHIDPEKEIRAERLKLGPLADNLPFTTVESATERVGSGETSGNIEQLSKEIELADSFGITDQTETSEDDSVSDS